MKINKIYPYMILGISGISLYYTIKGSDGGSFDDIWGSLSGGGGSSVEQTPDGINDAPEDDEPQKKTIPQDNTTQDFKMSIYEDTARNLSRSSGRSNISIKENNDLGFSVVSVGGSSVGGLDFRTNQSVTKKQIDLLDDNKNNKIVQILRGGF